MSVQDLVQLHKWGWMENIILKNLIRAYITGDAGMVNMAEYSTLEKAIKELENIRNEYEMTEMCKFDEQYRLNTSYRRFCYQLSQENDKELIECPF